MIKLITFEQINQSKGLLWSEKRHKIFIFSVLAMKPELYPRVDENKVITARLRLY